VPGVLAGIEEPDDPGVVQRRQQAHLAVEARPVDVGTGREDLHGDPSPEALVDGLVDLAHAAPRDQPPEAVPVDQDGVARESGGNPGFHRSALPAPPGTEPCRGASSARRAKPRALDAE
jgi:hypothetical protein